METTTVRVYHVKPEYFDPGVLVTRNQEPTLAFLRDPEEHLLHVADVEVENNRIIDANPWLPLGSAYEQTNHIDDDWRRNHGVIAHVGAARSTSVSDIMVLNGHVYRVAGIGFDRMGELKDFPAYQAMVTRNATQ